MLKTQGSLEEAIGSYRQALAIEPRLTVAHNNLGIISQKTDRLDEAAGSLGSVLLAQGKTASGLNLEAKNSVDLSIHPKELEQEGHEPIRDYLQALFACHRDYLEQ